MARVILVNLDLNGNQLLNVLAQVLATDPVSPGEGQLWYNSTTKVLKVRDGTRNIALGDLSQITAPTADVAMATHKITGLGDPSSAQDAATKAYVDSVATGLDVKDAVRLATAAALAAYTPGANTLTANANGSLTVDGVAVANGDRILVKNETTTSEKYNGLYVVTDLGGVGTPWILTRAADANTSAEVTSGLYAFVTAGSTLAATGWILTTADPITLGTTALTFTQFAASASYTAGAGLTLTGSTPTGGAGTGITVNADDVALTIPVAIASGGTGAITAPLALAALGGVGMYAASVGDTSATQFDLTHGLAASRDLVVQVFRVASPYDQVEVDVQHLSTTQVRLIFATAPGTNEFRVVVIG
jgi:hypothetical protein